MGKNLMSGIPQAKLDAWSEAARMAASLARKQGHGARFDLEGHANDLRETGKASMQTHYGSASVGSWGGGSNKLSLYDHNGKSISHHSFYSPPANSHAALETANGLLAQHEPKVSAEES
jgi:hypothetical protein